MGHGSYGLQGVWAKRVSIEVRHTVCELIYEPNITSDNIAARLSPVFWVAC